MLDYIYQLQKHQAVANNFNQQVKPQPANTTLLHFKDENNKLDFVLPLDQLIFIQAANNYVEINYLEGEQIKKAFIKK